MDTVTLRVTVLVGVLVVIWVLCAGGVSAAIPGSERAGLVDLYNATNGPGWTIRTNWMGASGTECTWYGVTCDALGLTVTKLLLDSNALRGHIPPDIGNLLNLEVVCGRAVADHW